MIYIISSITLIVDILSNILSILPYVFSESVSLSMFNCFSIGVYTRLKILDMSGVLERSINIFSNIFYCMYI